MGARELDALLRQTLDDTRITPATRTAIERVFTQRALDTDAVTLFCAQAIVLARASLTDGAMRDVFGWVLRLAEIARDAPPARACFSPGEECLDAIVGCFERARRTADVCVFTITDDRITRAMLAAHRRGVKLRVVSDDDKAGDQGSDIDALRRAGVPVRLDQSEAHMHHKFALFDGERLLTGSYNWTRGAANYNAENVLVTGDRALVRAFTEEFERLWERYDARR
ncbi:MAG: phospholipase D-like domain-containing protein [Polyangiales bacterium]